MVQNICLLFRKHAKVAAVEPPDDSASPHGVEAPTSGKDPFTPFPGILSSRVSPEIPTGQDTTRVNTPQVRKGLFIIEKKKKVLGETSGKLNKITSVGKQNMRFTTPISDLEEISQFQDSVQDQVAGNGFPSVSHFKGIKGKKPTDIVIKSSQKLRSSNLISIRPRRSVKAKPQKSPKSPIAQSPFHNDFSNSKSISQCNEKKFEDLQDSEILTEKVRPMKPKLKTKSLGDDLLDLGNYTNPFLKNKIAVHAIDRDSPDANEDEPIILLASANLGIGSLGTVYEPTKPVDSNVSIFAQSEDSPELQRNSPRNPSLFRRMGNQSERFRVDKRLMYLTI